MAGELEPGSKGVAFQTERRAVRCKPVGEIIGALLGTYLFTRLCAWSFRPTAQRAVYAALAAAVAVPWVAIALTTRSESPELTIPYLVVLYSLCVALWLVFDVWRFRRYKQLKLKTGERNADREAQRLMTQRRWTVPVEARELTPPKRCCDACGAAVPPDAQFCDGCGGKIGTECASCQTANREGARFCKRCGGTLGAQITHRSA
jgi:predicted nucleic acid-binding Zn ribbon protein